MGTCISAGILLVAGLVLLVVRPDEWGSAVLLIIVASVIHICDLRRGRRRFAPWSLTIVALVMPRRAAHSYLEELGHSANAVRGRERRRHVWHAVKASPWTLVTVWRRWLRTRLVELTVRAVSPRFQQVQLLVQDMAADTREYRAAVRRLRRYCRLILCATGRGQYHQYSGPARALLASCRQSAEDPGSVELAVSVRQEAKKLACALSSRRPDHA